MPHSRLLVALLAVVILGFGAQTTVLADPIIAPVGAATNGSGVNSAQYNLVRFTLGNSYTNVAIAASLNSTVAGRTGTAFLMNQVGPGTTVANELANTAFNFALVANPSTDVSYVNLFSGLSLGPGTYYLVFASAGDGGFFTLGTGVGYLTAPGTSVGVPQFTAGASINPYAPASTWGNSGLGNRFFTVDGTSTVPEPTTMFLLGSGIAAIGLKLRKRRKAK